MPVRSSATDLSRRTRVKQQDAPGKESTDEQGRRVGRFPERPGRPGENAHFCFAVGELVVIDFRLTFGWSGSPGFWGVMSAAVGKIFRGEAAAADGVARMTRYQSPERYSGT